MSFMNKIAFYFCLLILISPVFISGAEEASSDNILIDSGHVEICFNSQGSSFLSNFQEFKYDVVNKTDTMILKFDFTILNVTFNGINVSYSANWDYFQLGTENNTVNNSDKNYVEMHDITVFNSTSVFWNLEIVGDSDINKICVDQSYSLFDAQVEDEASTTPSLGSLFVTLIFVFTIPVGIIYLFNRYA